jgi:predicted glycogen debranching enzyme
MMPMLTLKKSECNDLDTAQSKEWIITNGIGGYASSTVAGMNTRRYHGLLVAATAPPVGRFVMLSKLEDALIIGGERVELSTNLYRGGVVHPTGYLHLEAFSLDPFPIYTYSGPGFELTKSIFMVHGTNTVVIEYTLSQGNAGEIALEVRPLIAFRDYHSTTNENGVLDPTLVETFGCVRVKPYPDLPGLFLAHDADSVVADGAWYRNFEYAEEKARGFDDAEDLFSPLVFRTSLTGHKRFVLIASTEKHSAADAAGYRRAKALRETSSYYQHHSKGERSDLITALERAAEQFIVARPPFKSVIAGYPWFADWGRDTMIALPGLLLCTGKTEAAKDILLEFERSIDRGMLPNRFPEKGETPEYNTVDATLWFFEAIWQYLHSRTEPAWKEEAWHLVETCFYPALKNIADFHLSGTRNGIHADDDGFLWAGDESTQLTWMDAKVGDKAITPRAGRPVEIQALWYNALRILEEFGREIGDNTAADRYAGIALRLRRRFEPVFWNHERQCLFDVVGSSWVDAAIRPNQVIAISLRHCLLGKERALDVLKVAERELLTPYGLRTLSPSDPNYRGRYEGDVWSRDSAYHQGTVWPWLAGPFFSAKLQFAGDRAEAVEETKAWLQRFSSHLKEAGLGQVSEIFDGDAPHQPRGCIAQAWSVAELLRLAKTVKTYRYVASFRTKPVETQSRSLGILV